MQIQQNPSRKPKLWWRKQGASGRVSVSLSPSEEQDLLDTAQLSIRGQKYMLEREACTLLQDPPSVFHFYKILAKLGKVEVSFLCFSSFIFNCFQHSWGNLSKHVVIEKL